MTALLLKQNYQSHSVISDHLSNEAKTALQTSIDVNSHGMQ